ncbi:hypothetical protein QL285_010196 [Trifolium repens]|nr:hypothetical protein QL285_010196 [Trifolium repens]
MGDYYVLSTQILNLLESRDECGCCSNKQTELNFCKTTNTLWRVRILAVASAAEPHLLLHVFSVSCNLLATLLYGYWARKLRFN